MLGHEFLHGGVRALIEKAAQEGVTLWAEEGRLHFRAHKGGMSDALRSALQSRKNDLIGELSEPVFRKRDHTPAVVPYPPYWAEFWQENQANVSLSHGTHFAIRLTGEVALARIESAIERLTTRHDVLRSKVRLENGIPCLVLEQDRAVLLDVMDVSGRPAAGRPSWLKAQVERALYAPFEAGQLFRAHVIKVSDGDYVLALVVHHFVADAISIEIILRELADSLCADRFSEEPAQERPLQYSDYLLGMNEWLVGEGLKYRLEYWLEKMRDAPAVCLPRTQEPHLEGRGKVELVPIRVDRSLRARLVSAAATVQAPFSVGLLAASFAALASTLHRRDLVTLVVHSGRTDSALFRLVGLTMNCFPVRVSVLPEMSYLELVTRVNDDYNLARDYRIPWRLLMRSLGEMGVDCMAPIFNHLPLARDGSGDTGASLQAASVEIMRFPVDSPEQTDSAGWKSHELSVTDTGVEALVTLKYVPSRYRSAAANELAAAYLRCMEQMAEDPTHPVGPIGPATGS
jgi:hypothetical protein